MKNFLSKFKYIVVAICCVFACGVSVPQNVYAGQGITVSNGCFASDYDFVFNTFVSGVINERTDPFIYVDNALSGTVHVGSTAVHACAFIHDVGDSNLAYTLFFYSNNSFSFDRYLHMINSGYIERDYENTATFNSTYSKTYGCHFFSIRILGDTISPNYDNDFSCSLPTFDLFRTSNHSLTDDIVIAMCDSGLRNGALDSDIANSLVNGQEDYSKSEYDPNGDKGTNDLHSLGHLENVKLTKFNVTDVVPLIMDKTYYSITYNFFTSSGFDLSKDVKNNTVQYCVTMQVYDSNNKILRSGSSDYYLALDSHFGEPDCPDNLFWKIYINKESSLITGLLDKLQTSIGVNADNFNKRGYKYVYQFNLRPYCVSDEGVTYGQWTVLKNIYTDNFDDLHYTVDSGDNSYDQTTVNDDGSLSNKENSTDKNSHVGSGSDAHDAQQNADSDTTHDSIIDKGQDWINDNIINGDYNIHIGGEDGSDVSLKGGVSAFTESIYAFANLVNSCFSWAPSWVKNFFALSIAIFCIMILKRAIF